MGKRILSTMPKDLREQLKKNIPDSLMTKEFNILLNLVKENGFKAAGELKSYIETKIASLNIELKEKRTSTTMTAEMRSIAKEVDTLKSIKDQFFKFF